VPGATQGGERTDRGGERTTEGEMLGAFQPRRGQMALLEAECSFLGEGGPREPVGRAPVLLFLRRYSGKYLPFHLRKGRLGRPPTGNLAKRVSGKEQRGGNGLKNVCRSRSWGTWISGKNKKNMGIFAMAPRARLIMGGGPGARAEFPNSPIMGPRSQKLTGGPGVIAGISAAGGPGPIWNTRVD